MEKRKISCSTHRSRSRSFCVVVLQWTAMKYRFTEHTCTAFVLLFKPFVWWCLLTLWFTPDSIHTTPKEFKNAYSFISTVRPTVQSNTSRKWSFSKTLFKPEEFENAGFEFSCGRKHFKTDHFEHDRIRRTT